MTKSPAAALPTIDPRAFRDVMGHYPTGVVMVAAMIDDQPVGMVVGTFSSVSLEPPLVSFMPMTSSATYAKLRNSDAICISVFAHDQIQACRTLASKDPEKFNKVAWTLSPYGVPQIDGAVAHIHGRITQEVEAGDHFITLVAVDELAVARPITPLLYFQGGYGGFSTTGMSAHVDESLISAVRIAEAARPQLDKLATRFGGSAAALVQVSGIDQTIGATSYGRNTEVDERIGVRIPLIPPLGEAAVAWSADQIEQWVARVLPRNDEEAIAGYRDGAARVREQGYAISRLDTDPSAYAALSEALAEYAFGELTPARDRAVRETIAASRACFGGSIGVDERSIDLASVVVPVFDPNAPEQANSGLVLRLGNIPGAVDATTVHEWISALQAAAEEVTETLRTTARRDFARYTSADLRNA
ncbi:flavin reductase [Mycetocola sp.]|uniref:flavin reductase n=1 Tax=Mycetocola sp. TaxID=1871042 RepID=UPI003988FE95